MAKKIAWATLVVSFLGLAITFPLWLFGGISDRTMIGLTLFLSWAAPAIEAFNGIFIAKAEEK